MLVLNLINIFRRRIIKMELIQATNIKLYFGNRIILDIPNLKIYQGDKIGIVGINGCGKSTLLNLLYGDLESDEGNIKKNAYISYHKQFCNNRLIVKPSTTSQIKKINLFKTDTQSSAPYSGGEKTRLQLAEIFSEKADIYFLDEPTSNLDYEGILLLQNELSKIQSFLLVSHERMLLNKCCNKIIEISDSILTAYTGNYEFYETQKNAAYNKKLFEYNQYNQEKKRLMSIYHDKLTKANKIAKKPKDPGKRISKECGSKSFSSKAKSTEKAAQVALKKINMLEKKEKPTQVSQIKLDFRLTTPPRNQYILQINDLTFGYDSNLLFNHLNLTIKNKEKVAILGKNGIGKTTLLDLIYNGHEAIKVVPNANLGYFKQDISQLNDSTYVLENAKYDSIQNEYIVRTMLARLLFDEQSLSKKVNVLSGGEKIRLALAKLIVSNANVLILDEPTNYLDLPSRTALETVLQDYSGTIVFVSHDISFVNAIATKFYIIENKQIIEKSL